MPSDRMTGIWLGDTNWPGLGEHGRCTRETMIHLAREWARERKAQADAILAAADEDFHIETYVGAFVHRDAEVLQEGKPARSAT